MEKGDQFRGKIKSMCLELEMNMFLSRPTPSMIRMVREKRKGSQWYNLGFFYQATQLKIVFFSYCGIISGNEILEKLQPRGNMPIMGIILSAY